MKTHTQKHPITMRHWLVRGTIALTTSLFVGIGYSPLAAIAQTNASDNSGGNVSDITGGNGSDISGGDNSTSAGDNTDNGTAVLANNIQSALNQLNIGCGDGCSTIDLGQILAILTAAQDSCASLSTCTDEVQQRLEAATNRVQRILDQN